jgi:hypothetical protein
MAGELPDVPQSWFAFVKEIGTIIASISALVVAIVAASNGCKHGRQIEDNSQRIERHAEKISELKSMEAKQP